MVKLAKYKIAYSTDDRIAFTKTQLKRDRTPQNQLKESGSIPNLRNSCASL